jgi:cytochrome P450
LNMRSETDQPLEPRQLQNEVITFVLAGHETTATALTWTWLLLATHPAVAARLRQEIDTVLGDRPATLDDAARLTYTAVVFQESMRLYPPALAFARRTKEAIDLAGYVVPRGCSVFVSPYVTQRNPKYFADADRFRPERWEADPPPPKFAYFPFGGGAKMCIGEPFARLEGVLALATLARRWELQALSDDSVGIGAGMLLNPDRPMMMKLQARASADEQLSRAELIQSR